MVQERLDTTNRSFFLSGTPKIKDSETVAQIAGATTDLTKHTLMCKDPATSKWEPYSDVTAVDGTEVPRGILNETIPVASLVAGDVEDIQIIIGGPITFASDQLTLGSTFTYASEITNQNKTIEDALVEIGLNPESVNAVSELENS